MAPSGKQTTVEERKLIIKLHESGKTFREIAVLVNRAHSTVQYIIKRYKNDLSIVNKSRVGQGKKLSDRDERLILREVKKNAFVTAVEINRTLKEKTDKIVCDETIRNVLKRNHYHGRIARKKPYISPKNKKARMKFATDYITKDINFWKTVLFTDESKFNLKGSAGKCYVWRKPNAEFDCKNTKPTVKHGGGSVMVWGCVSSSGVGNIEFIEGNMDKYKYLDILKNNVKQSAERLGIIDNFAFYQDNDPKHTSMVARMWLIYNCPKLLQTPAQSPDLNIIEHVWEELSRRLKDKVFRNVNELKETLRTEWYNISPEVCKNLVESMPKRLNAVLKAKGLSTKY